MPLHVEGRPTTLASLHVKCPCGRELRARPDQAGAEITCWSCHAHVPVPIPVAPGGWVARLLRMGARQILDARIVTLLSIGAVLVTVALSLTSLEVPLGPRVMAWFPQPGMWAAAVALALVMAGYGELLRRGSEGDWAPRPRVGPAALIWRAFLCLGAGTALVLPLIIASEGHIPPRLTPAGLAVALGLTLALPLVMLATYYPRGSVAGRFRMIGSILGRHPMAVLASLLILPLSLPLLEAMILLLAKLTMTLPFLVVDLFPGRSDIQLLNRYTYYAPNEARTSWIDLRYASDSIIFGFYADALRHGYTMLGAIPASLALRTRNGYDPYAIELVPSAYLLYRMAFTLVIVAGMLGALAVQARWLGLLSTLDSRRSAATP